MQKASRNLRAMTKPYIVKKRQTMSIHLDEPYQDIEMECRRVSLGDVFEYEDRKYRDQITWFASECLISWNLTDEEGEPIPTNEEGMLSLEHALILGVLGAWYQRVLRPEDPLEMPSKNGVMSPVG